MRTKKTVFLSSTCYDLADVRKEIEDTLPTMGFSPMLSDRSTFPVDPKMHRHDVCLANAKMADLFILVVDARYGAPYYKEPGISVTWAEFLAAKESHVPMLAFVRGTTWDERKKFKDDPTFKPSHVNNVRLFDFLTAVQASEHGVWMEIYNDKNDIVTRLKNITELFGSKWAFRTVPPPRVNGGKANVAALSLEAQHLVHLVCGEEQQTLREDDLLRLLNSLPEAVTREWVPDDAFKLHGFSLAAEKIGDDVIVRPTELGLAIREELESVFDYF